MLLFIVYRKSLVIIFDNVVIVAGSRIVPIFEEGQTQKIRKF